MALRYYSSTYLELTEFDALPTNPIYGLRAMFLDTKRKLTFYDDEWHDGWYSNLAQGAIAVADIPGLSGIGSDHDQHTLVYNHATASFILIPPVEVISEDSIPEVTHMELLGLIDSRLTLVGDKYTITDQDMKRIRISHISEDGSCFYESITNDGVLSHTKIK